MRLNMALAMLTASALAGCTAPNPSMEPLVASFDVPGFTRPIIINETDGTAILDVRFAGTLCPFSGLAQELELRIYDAAGLLHREHQVLAVEPPLGEAVASVPFELAGEAPFLVIGQLNGCGSSKSSVRGNGTAFSLSQDGVRASLAWLDEAVEVRVPVGSLSGEASWAAGDFSVRLDQMFPDGRNFTGATSGRISSYYPNGTLGRWDTYGLRGDDARYDPVILTAGEYRVVLELDTPHPTETLWPYVFRQWHLTPELCQFGFQWPMCTDG